MTTARLGPRAATGPLVAALGALAAATLIAASLTGSGFTSDPWDVPAIAQAPDRSADPIVLRIPRKGVPAAPLTTADLARPASFLDDLPTNGPGVEASSPAVTTLKRHQRTAPAPREQSTLGYARRRVSEIIRDGLNRGGVRKGVAVARHAPVRATVARPARSALVAAEQLEPAEHIPGDPPPLKPSDPAAVTHNPVGIVGEEMAEIQPDVSTVAGSPSPLE